MKFRKILLMGAIAIGMIACKNDVINGEKPIEEVGDAYVSFAIYMPNSAARAAASDVDKAEEGNTYVGTLDEQAVKSVRVVLYDENNHAAYTFDFNPAAAHGTGDNAKKETEALYITDAKKVEKKDYKALVLINPGDAVKGVTQRSMNLSAFNQAVKATVDDLTGKDGFFMSNAEGLSTVKAEFMQNTKEGAEANPFKDTENDPSANGIKVDRAVAKVFVGGTPIPTSQALGTVQIKGWTLDVTNKKLFWMRNFAKIAEAKDKFVAESKKNNNNRWIRYAMDPNFISKDANPDEFNYIVPPTPTATTRIGVPDNYYPTTFLSAVVADSMLKAPTFNDNDGLYVLENTMQPWCQYAGVTTRVIIKAVFTPKGFTEGESWYSFDNVPMTRAKFMEYLDSYKELGKLPNDAPHGLVDAFSHLLYGVDENNNPVEPPYDFTQDENKDSYVVLFDKGNTDGDPTYATNKKLKFYKNGECYYSVKIRHFNDDLSSLTDYSHTKPNVDNGYGRYGVVRNNIYKLTLNTISQPGSPIIETPDPEEKNDVEELWLSVKTEIMPWLVRTQMLDL